MTYSLSRSTMLTCLRPHGRVQQQQESAQHLQQQQQQQQDSVLHLRWQQSKTRLLLQRQQ
jgi:hypothetical protein